jgi:hypothetical protein
MEKIATSNLVSEIQLESLKLPGRVETLHLSVNLVSFGKPEMRGINQKPFLVTPKRIHQPYNQTLVFQ